MLKSQTVRLLDVAVIGPVMIISAVALRRRPPLAWLLGFFGVTTVWYNAYNYLRYRDVSALESRVTGGPPS